MSRQRVTVMATGRQAWQDYGEPVMGVTVDVASVQAVVRRCERALTHQHAIAAWD